MYQKLWFAPQILIFQSCILRECCGGVETQPHCWR